MEDKKETSIVEKVINPKPLKFRDEKEGTIEAIEEYIAQNRSEDTFRVIMFGHIDKRGLKDAEVYKRAGLTRNVFYCIKRGGNYKISKNSALRLGIGLELTLDELEYLLRSAGYSLNPTDPFDLIIRYFLERRIYDMEKINLSRYTILGIFL